MNKPRVLWGVMMLGAALLLQSRSQPLWAMSTGGERAVASPGPARPMTATALGVTMISVGWYSGDAHTCAVTTTGGAKCWGLNGNGELGNNSTTTSNVPVDVNGLANGVTVIAAGQGHSCAVASGGAKCWGDNSYGQLGDGTTTESHIPVAVSGLASGVIQVATGPYHSCALTSGGGVKCWGRNTFGQLGNNSTTDSHAPVDVSGLASGVTAIAAGISHTCALLSGGAVKCWGLNGSGQLGDGTTTESHIPVPVSGLTGATAIATGGSHSCALTNAGQAKCWGDNYSGQLGDGSTTESHVPVLVSALSGVTALDAGDSHTCAVATGGARCWGWNAYGQLGNNSLANSAVPVDVTGLGSGVAQIAAGTANSCAVMSGGGAKCWGENYAGELGNGELWTQSVPVTVSGLGGDMVAVGTGYMHSCALTSSGGVKCWGDNRYGELGNNSTAYSATAVDVNGLSSGVAAISVNQMYACALTSGGGVKCWGYNGDGQLGNNSTTDSPVPVNVNGLNSGVQAIAAGAHHACALLSGGGVKCWGSDYFGQLGDGSTTNSPIPVDVSSLNGVTAISAGGNHTCAVASGGAVKCWGRNANGQLGNNSTANSSVPVDVSGLGSGATAIAGGAAHTCAVASGGAKCWGYNYYGQLGNGSTTESHIPVNVNGLGSGIAKIAAATFHSCALTSGGGVQCWGDNWYGELGNNSTTNSSVPVDVSGLASGVNSIAAGSSTNCVVVGPLGGRTVQCWGDGYYGQLGNGKFGYRVTPVNVSGLLGQLSLYLPIVFR